MAKNRYGWQKRAKELARKEKNDEKMKRRQGKSIGPAGQNLPEEVQALNLSETGPASDLQIDS